MTQLSHPLWHGLDARCAGQSAPDGSELTAAASGAALILIRLVEEQQWLPIAIVAAVAAAYGSRAAVRSRSKSRVRGLRRAARWAGTAVTGVAVLYLFVVSIGAALWITGKPRVAVHPWAVPHRNVELTAPDGVRLAAWYVPLAKRRGGRARPRRRRRAATA